MVARQVASPSGSPGLLQIGPLILRPTFSAVDDCRLFLPNGECSDEDHNPHIFWHYSVEKHGNCDFGSGGRRDLRAFFIASRGRLRLCFDGNLRFGTRFSIGPWCYVRRSGCSQYGSPYTNDPRLPGRLDHVSHPVTALSSNFGSDCRRAPNRVRSELFSIQRIPFGCSRM